jgi:uncharacterized protein YdeI (BOF family)
MNNPLPIVAVAAALIGALYLGQATAGGAQTAGPAPAAATPAASQPMAPAAAAFPAVTIGSLRRGMMVAVTGEVERILDTDEFRLRDATGSVKVDVGYPNWVPVQVGERVTVHGFVDRELFLEIYAREIVHSDGRVSRLDRSRDD